MSKFSFFILLPIFWGLPFVIFSADFSTGVGYKMTILKVDRSFDNGSQTTTGMMLQNIVEPEVSLEFGKSSADGFGLGFRIGASKFTLNNQIVETDDVPRNLNLGTQVSGTYSYMVLPAFYRYPIKKNPIGLIGVVGEYYYGSANTDISGEIYLTKNCSAVIGQKDNSELSNDIKSECEKVTLNTKKNTFFQGAQLELQGNSFAIVFRSMGPSLTDDGGGIKKEIILLETSIIINYRF